MSKSQKTKICPDTGEVLELRRTYTEFNRRRPLTPTGTPRVKSEFKDECDINKIVARIKKTGDISRLNSEKTWQECDFTTLPTNYTDATLLTIKVRDQFMRLDSKTRKNFDNDPALWLENLQNAQKATREAQKLSEATQASEAAKDAEYRQKRRDALLKPTGDDLKK